MSGWDIPDFLFAADEIEDLTLSQACETIENENYAFENLEILSLLCSRQPLVDSNCTVHQAIVLDIQYYNYNLDVLYYSQNEVTRIGRVFSILSVV
jgi:hypothetical protein